MGEIHHCNLGTEMSIVAWDGKSIAADKMSISDGMCTTVTKIVRLDDGRVAAWVGETSIGLALLEWIKTGNPDKWPVTQRTENWACLIVANWDGVIFYEREPFAQEVHEPFMAWGSGRDFAIGAMAMGANAKQAVEIANTFSTTCGNGIRCFNLIDEGGC